MQGGQIRVVTVASGLVHPWSIALLPDDRSMLVAERNGRRALDSRRHARRRARVVGGRRRGRQRAQVARAAPALRLEPARLPFVSEGGRARHDARRRARPLRRQAVARRPRDIRRGRLGDRRQPRREDPVRSRRDAVRHGRRSRSALLHRYRGQQPAHEGAGPRQSRRQDAAHSRRRQRAARQSVRGPCGRQARDLHVRPPQRIRARVPSRDRRPVAGRDRADGRRRGEHPAAGSQLRVAARIDGPQLHRLARRPTSRVTATAWTTRACSGCRRSARRA